METQNELHKELAKVKAELAKEKEISKKLAQQLRFSKGREN